MAERLPALGRPHKDNHTMTPRSSRREVRNPILALDAVKTILTLPQDQRFALAGLLMDLSRDARQRAQKAWLSQKPPMASYWMATSVVAKHIARALKQSPPQGATAIPWDKLEKAA
ncbi:MAG: hypothetical protein Q8R98_17870 [Rubrivivax sp.]|nr:hypothetical protein [Rubrivivax sp.]MDZ4053105.1 hypothetical protein [Phenylobacterium sp.]